VVKHEEIKVEVEREPEQAQEDDKQELDG